MTLTATQTTRPTLTENMIGSAISAIGHPPPRRNSNADDVPGGTTDSKEAPKQGICPFFKRGTCRFGLSGKGCPKQHPKACPKLINHGNRGPRGCTKGNDCEKFHPRMCQQSLRAGECLTTDCKLRHIKGTKRTTSSHSEQDYTRPQRQSDPRPQGNLQDSNIPIRRHNTRILNNLPPSCRPIF